MQSVGTHIVRDASNKSCIRAPFVLGGPDSPEARTRMLSTIPIGRFAVPADIGNAAAFLASEEATMITGAALDVDGGRGI